MKFKFRLESVLKLRKQVEDQRQREYLMAKSAVDQCLGAIRNMYDEITQSRQLVHTKENSNDESQIASMLVAHDFIEGQKVKIERKRQEARELMQVAEQKLEVFKVAMTDRKSIEKMKERKFQQFKLEKKRKEEKFFDDMAIIRAGSK